MVSALPRAGGRQSGTVQCSCAVICAVICAVSWTSSLPLYPAATLDCGIGFQPVIAARKPFVQVVIADRLEAYPTNYPRLNRCDSLIALSRNWHTPARNALELVLS